MNYFAIPFLSLSLLLVGCGDDKKEGVEALPMTSQKQEISYLIGADHAHQLDQDPNAAKYDQEQIVKGFESGLSNATVFNKESEELLIKFLGAAQNEFNEQYKVEGSNAIGKFLGATFNKSWTDIGFMSEFDKKYVIYGFELGIRKQDTLIEEKIKQNMLNSFMTKVNTRITSEVSRKESVFFSTVKQMKGIQELPQGLYMETLKAGTGASPTLTDDIKAHYVLMNTKGDTLQSSLDSQPLLFNLGGVIPGWTVAFPMMKKGGIYKLYVPQGMAYGAQSPDPIIPPFSTLVFYIELKEIAKAGTLK